MHCGVEVTESIHMNICTYVYIYICICLVCLGRLGLGGLFFHFILGSNLGGVGPVRGLRGEGRGGWCEEWARSG